MVKERELKLNAAEACICMITISRADSFWGECPIVT
jgi:hypothetical protein